MLLFDFRFYSVLLINLIPLIEFNILITLASSTGEAFIHPSHRDRFPGSLLLPLHSAGSSGTNQTSYWPHVSSGDNTRSEVWVGSIWPKIHIQLSKGSNGYCDPFLLQDSCLPWCSTRTSVSRSHLAFLHQMGTLSALTLEKSCPFH